MKTTFCDTVTSDKLRLHGLLFEPDGESKKAVLYVHGLTGDFYGAIFLPEMIRQFPAAGYAFMSASNRGQNFMYDHEVVSDDTETYNRSGAVFECFEDCAKDISAWIALLKDHGYEEVVLLGHSFGAAKALYYQCTKRDPVVQGLILASPTDIANIRKGKNTTLVPRYGKSLVFWLYSLAKWQKSCKPVFADYSNADMFPVHRHGQEGAFKALESITVPILIIFSGEDENAVFSPERDLEVLLSHCTCETGTSAGVLIDCTSHSYFKHEKEVAQKIVRWLDTIFHKRAK